VKQKITSAASKRLMKQARMGDTQLVVTGIEDLQARSVRSVALFLFLHRMVMDMSWISHGFWISALRLCLTRLEMKFFLAKRRLQFNRFPSP
jgi:hypothetical protein